MLSRWVKRGLITEGLNALVEALGFGNPLGALVTLAYSLGALIMGWLTARHAWAEGVLSEWGTLGYVAIILGVALSLGLLFAIVAWSYRTLRPIDRARPRTSAGISVVAEELGEEPDEDDDALHDLTLFAIDYVMPLAYAHFKLQTALIARLVPDALPASLAIGNLMTNHETRRFGEHYDAINARFSGSPMERIPFKELKDRVFQMDKNFSRLSSQTAALAAAANTDLRTDEKLAPMWNDIRTLHNALVAEYKKIKRDRRFQPELYRPGINGPWTKTIQ